ncbi:glucokinase [Herbaspirillum sp.]|uniref:glucokinase n=1 Tax=Herbaspirillum sp. TaxID=1890675 RepID=UPI0031D9F2CF
MQTGQQNSPTTHHGAGDYVDGPRLLADIGGTNARFALEPGPNRIEAIKTLPAADYREFTDAVQAYLRQTGHPPVRHAVVAIANPVQGDQIKMTNHDWAFSIEAARQLLGFGTLLLVNDFTALSMAVPQLQAPDLRQIGGGAAAAGSPIGVVGAGTGLGVGGLVRGENRWLPLASEGGHVSFSPANSREVAILAYGWRTYEHLSAERLVSGPGLELIHRALLDADGLPAAELKAGQIVERGLLQGDRLCKETVDIFCSMLGTVAANLAVTLGALGGIYIGGGVVLHLGDYFERSPFRARFENKGRMSALTRKIPTYVITAKYPAFIGVSAMLGEKLGDRRHASAG